MMEPLATIYKSHSDPAEIIGEVAWRFFRFRLVDISDLLQKFDLNGAGLNSGRSYAAGASNCCLIESAFAVEKTPCCLRII
jgi:hypothetical protein